MKLHLRHEAVDAEVEALVPPEHFLQLQASACPPLRIAVWIEDYLQQQYQTGRVYIYQSTQLNSLLGRMVDTLGVCERILRTPMPLAYNIHLKQLLLIYCFLMPLGIVHELELLTGPLVFLVSFMLFGVEEIGLEIENPFGHDDNDLRLDAICKTMHHNIEEMILTTPNAPKLICDRIRPGWAAKTWETAIEE